MNGMRGNHLGGGMSEQYMAHPDNFAHPPRAVARGRNHINHYSATDYTSFDPHMEHGYRCALFLARLLPVLPSGLRPPAHCCLPYVNSSDARFTHACLTEDCNDLPERVSKESVSPSNLMCNVSTQRSGFVKPVP